MEFQLWRSYSTRDGVEVRHVSLQMLNEPLTLRGASPSTRVRPG